MERYHEMGRYVDFRHLYVGIWEWQNAPGSVIGCRLLLTIRWALDGTWRHRALAAPDVAWRRLLAAHATANRGGSSTLAGEAQQAMGAGIG